MEEVRDFEQDTNFQTAVGRNIHAAWQKPADFLSADEALSSSSGEEKGFPCHQPEEDEVEWVPTEAEKDAKERHALAKSSQGVKRPLSPPLPPNFDATPDLHEIFDNYDTPLNVRVSICRAYASYISSTLPRKPKKFKLKPL